MSIVTARRCVVGLVMGALLTTAACGASGRSNRAVSTTSVRARTDLPSPFTVVHRYRLEELGLRNPRWFAVGPQGDFYITDARDRVWVFSQSLKPITSWGGHGSKPGRFDFTTSDPTSPGQLTADVATSEDGHVVVADSGNYRYEIFTGTGTFIAQFGGLGMGPGQFVSLPGGVAVAANGDIFVVEDAMAGRLSKFSPDGHFIWTKSPDSKPGHLHLSDIDAHGRLVLVNDDAPNVVYVSQDGEALDQFDSPSGTIGCGASVDNQGDQFEVSCVRRQPMYEFDSQHRLIGRLPTKTVSLMTPPMLAPDGDWWAMTYDHQLVRLHRTS